jgi:hypothetical protein
MGYFLLLNCLGARFFISSPELFFTEKIALLRSPRLQRLPYFFTDILDKSGDQAGSEAL